MTNDRRGVTRAIGWLGRSWWLLFPAFTALTIRLGVERACAEPYDLLPAVTSNPAWAWPLAFLYVLTHVWVAASVVTTAVAADTLLPSLGVWRTLWGREAYKLLAMVAALAVEYAPLEWWHWLGRMAICSLP
jgi:hypothetical protein